MNARRDVDWLVWLVNVALGAWIGRRYLDGLPLDDSTRLWLFAHLGLLSTIATLALIPFALCWCVQRMRAPESARGWTQAVVWMLFQIALVIDTHVWGLFRYHLNGAAWNLITSKGSEDSYRLGPKVWTFAFSLGAALTLGEWLLRKYFARATQDDAAECVGSRVRGGRYAAWAAASVVLFAVGIEKGIYARADLDRDPTIESVSRALPLYPRLPVSELLPETAQNGFVAAPKLRIAYDGAPLRYPLEVPSIDPHGPRPNILVLVIDSWRRDMLDDQVTPRLARFAQRARRFEDHLSTGNGTRFGVFGLVYGLHGSYWWPTLAAERSPVLLDSLAALGYESRVYSSASMDYPEFRRTAWSRISDGVYDDFGERRPFERDRLAADACIAWWRDRDPSTPFFAFVLLDSAHQKYDFPDECAKFTPFARDIDYLELAGSREPELVERVRNRYRNALVHVDEVAARLLDELEHSGALENTLVIVTGDHGEEFAENGYWGHTGNFTAAQVAVPFLMLGPGVTPGVETRPSSHVDVPATLLEACGADPSQRSHWTHGANLLQLPAQRARVVAGWEELGLWTESGIFRVPRDEGSGQRATVCDARWQLRANAQVAFAREHAALAVLVEECARFLDLTPLASLGGR